MTEFFDWVDRNNQVIGVTTREDAHRLQLYHRAVHLYARGRGMVFNFTKTQSQ